MKRLFIFFVFLFSFAVLKAASLPPPYCDIKVLPYDNHSLFVNHVGLKAVLRARKVKTVVEIGAWLGASTRFTAENIPPDGKVYAVDHWRGSAEHPSRAYFQKRKNRIYQQFLSNIIHAGLTHKIVPVRMDSLEASNALDVKPDLVYVDGSHDTQSVYNDLVSWFPKIKGHGVICGDDWAWGGPALPVQVAVKKFARERNLKVIVAKNNMFWQLQEK